jgi:hypothetical protein
MTERFLDWFAIRSSTAWYPQAVEGRSKAIFDLTFHNPKGVRDGERRRHEGLDRQRVGPDGRDG